jgi:hypothetical protein
MQFKNGEMLVLRAKRDSKLKEPIVKALLKPSAATRIFDN